MAVIIIGTGGGKAAIQALHDASVRGEIAVDDATAANAHIDALKELAKKYGHCED